MEQFIIFVVVIVVGLIVKAVNKKTTGTGGRNPGTPNPRVQKLIERIQAQQGGNVPIQFQGQFTQPTSGPPAPGQVVNSAGQVVRPTGPVQDPGRAQASAQLSGMLQQLMQAGQTAGRFGQEITGPGQYAQQSGPGQQGQPGPGQQYPGPQTGYTPPGQFQPPQFQAASFQAVPPPWVPAYQPPQAKRPPQNKGDLDARIRELMATGNEVAAVRLICDEKDLGIIDAQKYARSVVDGPAKARSTTPAPAGLVEEKTDEDARYVGSAAFAESVFDTREDDNVWASGWVDKPELEDRTDIDELWQTVQNAGRPQPPAN
ncbi:hypothetical protein EV138_5956 [Kribbella voronezhensis]|uniref:Uncharacterized protein n=1 Tax=Kribbella voronezhensis TaxID=2512212 RepID=A0A4R7SVY5_9ACTN|nr:hypothetical protein [Kribbella voronezhensis]TDU83492.1 hypothetical protein EV138_5956 [Kribbella voronezhensis]